MQGRSDPQRELLDVESVAGHLLPEGGMFAFLAAHRRELFPDELFVDLFATGRGRPSVPVEQVASVLVLQTLHNVSDREAVEALTFDLRWKAACGLAVTDSGFHPTTLTYWRRRLAASDRPERIFDVVRAVVAETGALAGKHRRALDSTILDDAVATQDTITQIIAAVRRVAREVPGAAEVIAAQARGHDYTQAGKPQIAWGDEQARAELVDALVGDAHRILGHLPDQELDAKAAEAVGLLALVAGQDVEPAEGSDGRDGRWRIARRTAPDRVISTVDPEARHAHKTRHRRQDGYKAHLVVEPDTGIITATALTPAAGPDNSDAAIGITLLDREPGQTEPGQTEPGQTEPGQARHDQAGPRFEVLADSAYGTGEMLAALEAAGHRPVIKPWPLRPTVPGGFSLDDFTVDENAGLVTCPNGITTRITRSRYAVFGARCRGCPLASRCTTSASGRTLRLHPHDALQRAHRARAADPQFAAIYRRHRPMVERSIAWLTRGTRRLRFRGTRANDLWLSHRAAALNLRRLLALGLHRQPAGAWALA
ncbi:IS1182 family transposase [Pseudonocardia kujensis]|uniref:IS1182 family transposase n=1 Tax=Pseudonocardia kujensis TaxID=1128675 RepID=UPI001E4072C8|nr:IS1182 family transposase [Pseudonocardia kujensis]MCE0768781.1 IS1182 family transposase [Pseudonocardia kujensis]